MISKDGGIWADMDMIFLRDYVPILVQDFAYMWGSSLDFGREHPEREDCFGPCAAMLGASKNSEFTQRCLEEILRTQIVPMSCCFDHELTAKVWRDYKFTVFPSAFFNTEWMIGIKDRPLVTSIEEGWFKNNGVGNKYLFPEAFAWHWHNSSNKHKEIEVGSKFHALQTITDQKLKEKGIL
jgi:hypothetical protein